MPKYDELRRRLSQRGVNLTAAQLEQLSHSKSETFKCYTRLISQMSAVANTAFDVYTTGGMEQSDRRKIGEMEDKILSNFSQWVQKHSL